VTLTTRNLGTVCHPWHSTKCEDCSFLAVPEIFKGKLKLYNGSNGCNHPPLAVLLLIRHIAYIYFTLASTVPKKWLGPQHIN